MVSGRSFCDAVFVDRRHARVVERDPVVDRAVFHAAQAKVAGGVAQQLHAVGTARVGVGEADELVGIFRDRSRRGLIVALDPGRIAVAQREHDRPVDTLHRRVERVGIRLEAHAARPDARHLIGEQRRKVPLLPDVDVAVDDHRQASPGILTSVARARGRGQRWSRCTSLEADPGHASIRRRQNACVAARCGVASRAWFGSSPLGRAYAHDDGRAPRRARGGVWPPFSCPIPPPTIGRSPGDAEAMTLKVLAIESHVQPPAARVPAAGQHTLAPVRVRGVRQRPAGTPETAPTATPPPAQPSDRPHTVAAEATTGCQVRRLGPDDAAAFQALRLEGLATDPCAFAASHDEEAGHSLIEVAARLERQPVFGVVAEGVLLAVAGFSVPEAAKKRHKGLLWGVYVREAARGSRPRPRCRGSGDRARPGPRRAAARRGGHDQRGRAPYLPQPGFRAVRP